MAILRFQALNELFSRKPLEVIFPSYKTSDYYGVNVFDREKMQKFLSKDAYHNVIRAIERGTKIERETANQIALGMKAWAVERGATHYTHWFQPLNDATAEKHDAFFDIDKQSGKSFESFDGNLLVQQEPDASSLPSGGIRNTFEARGYTAWDPSSPAFIIETTLCIPTIFVSYTGEALDYKTPLLKALTAIDEAGLPVCRLFDANVQKVYSNLGWEQEYFLVDSALYEARPDLVLTERTLMGHSSARNQQLEDHYFGAIPERIAAYMCELEVESYKLGIPLKTRHNEVAPNQFECAPIYEETNLAVDHNQLLMALMKKIARKHNLRVIFHEKPFKGINGSGKHCNWSLSTNTGINLLAPGKNPKSNFQFLTFLINIVRAVYEHADLLRASIASHGNEHRLGANEAPPAIISVFLGTQLSKILEELEIRVPTRKMTPDEKTNLKLDIGKIPEILLDNTDRNRTSPFAFTGNRFEFRAVGASANSAAAMIALNTAVADQLKLFTKEVNELMLKKVKKDEAIFQVLRRYIIESKTIRFEGNGYSQEWVVEAQNRGLTNITDAPSALKAYLSEKSIDLFVRNNVLSKRELEARTEIRNEIYAKKIQIESRVLGDIAINHIIPTALKYQSSLIDNVRGLKEIFTTEEYNSIAAHQITTIRDISLQISEIRCKVLEMVEARRKANIIDSIEQRAEEYSKNVKPFLKSIRAHIDHLELIIDDEIWPLPKYRELLASR